MKIIEKEFNILTGETTLTERDETTLEKDFRLASEEKARRIAQLEEEKNLARQTILDKLGLTSEEIEILLS